MARCTIKEIKKPPPIAEGAVRISGLQRLTFTVDLVGFLLPPSFYPGSFAGDEGFMVTLTINKHDP